MRKVDISRQGNKLLLLLFHRDREGDSWRKILNVKFDVLQVEREIVEPLLIPNNRYGVEYEFDSGNYRITPTDGSLDSSCARQPIVNSQG